MPGSRSRRRPDPVPRAAAPPSPQKLQRWMDLLAALLQRRYPATFESLSRDVPAYQSSASEDAMKRMFERDKDELRAFGVSIQTRVEGDPPESSYLLARRDFYLPFLELAECRRQGSGSGDAARRPAPPGGYSSLERLAVQADELEMVSRAAQRVRDLGDPLLALDVESAMRKLAFDLPVDSMRPDGNDRILAEEAPLNERSFALLGEALIRRKVVTFTYRAITSDTVTEREVEPYGLVFLGAHWYLVGRDRARNAMRQFRLSRMSRVARNEKRAQTPDFDVPPDFHLGEYARSRQAWNLGDAEGVAVIVEFRARTGAVRAAERIGEPVQGHDARRRYRVRRPDVFARWLLSFAGAARPVSPESMTERYRRLAEETLAVYEQGGRR